MSGNDKNNHILASRYAQALYQVAVEKGERDQIAQELEQLREFSVTSKDFQALTAPTFSQQQRQDAISALCLQAKLSPSLQSFLFVLVQNNRLSLLGASATAYLELYAQENGETQVQVQAAQALTAEQEKILTELLQASLKGQVNLAITVNPKLLGGLIVRLGSRMIDLSLATKLQKLQTSMKGVA